MNHNTTRGQLLFSYIIQSEYWIWLDFISLTSRTVTRTQYLSKLVFCIRRKLMVRISCSLFYGYVWNKLLNWHYNEINNHNVNNTNPHQRNMAKVNLCITLNITNVDHGELNNIIWYILFQIIKWFIYRQTDWCPSYIKYTAHVWTYSTLFVWGQKIKIKIWNRVRQHAMININIEITYIPFLYQNDLIIFTSTSKVKCSKQCYGHLQVKINVDNNQNIRYVIVDWKMRSTKSITQHIS